MGKSHDVFQQTGRSLERPQAEIIAYSKGSFFSALTIFNCHPRQDVVVSNAPVGPVINGPPHLTPCKDLLPKGSIVMCNSPKAQWKMNIHCLLKVRLFC